MKNSVCKRLLSLALTLLVFFGGVCFNSEVDGSVSVSAAGNVKARLDSFMKIYPPDSSWTGTFAGGKQCYGFGVMAIYNVFGASNVSGCTYRTWTYSGTSNNGMNTIASVDTFDAGSVQTLLSKAKCGDILQFDTNKQHTMIVYSVDADGVTIYDCNWIDNCGIRLKECGFGAWNGRDSAKLTLLRANNYDEIEGGATVPTPAPDAPITPDTPITPENIVHVDYPAENASGQEYMEVSGWIATNSPISYLMMQIQGYENGNGGQINLSLHDSPSEAAGFTQTYFKRFRGVIETKYLTINQWYEYLIFNNDIPISHTGSFKYTGVHTPPSRSIINVDYPSGHYDEYNHIELKGWIVANEPISYVMAEIVGVTQYDMDFWDYPQLANAYPGYAYYKQFYTVIDINLLDSDQIYTLYVWTSVGDGVYTKTFTTGDVEPNNYTVNFNANEGENVPGSISVASGESFTIPDEIPTRLGHNFLGWSANDSVEVAKYFPGDVITPDCHYELYAVWEVAPFAFNETANIANVELESDNGYVKFKAGSLSVSDIKSLFSNTDISIYNNKGKALTSGIVGTGATVTSVVEGSSYTLTIVVLGDVDGNGFINARDQNGVTTLVAGTVALEGAYLVAADVTTPLNGNPNARDVNAIAGYIAGTTANFNVPTVQ